METNEQMKRILREAVREELERFFEEVDEIAEGQLEQLEEQVVKTSQQLGRSLLEGVLDSRLRGQRPAARREGSCGHRQRLVGERPKELLTLVGKVRFVRPYYQCLEVCEQDRTCTHGEAPDGHAVGFGPQIGPVVRKRMHFDLAICNVPNRCRSFRVKMITTRE